MERSTHPGLDLRPAWTKEKGVATISELRPRLARCREVFQMVRWRTCDSHAYNAL